MDERRKKNRKSSEQNRDRESSVASSKLMKRQSAIQSILEESGSEEGEQVLMPNPKKSIDKSRNLPQPQILNNFDDISEKESTAKKIG